MAIVECPNHEGSFDCTPFCNLCEGNQEYEELNAQVLCKDEN